MPDVSVIVPVYNAECYLEQCIRSICKQSLKNIEIICVNDGSTDRSLDILEVLSLEDTRIYIINQENGGAGLARNRGMAIATGRYLSFLDADDFFEPNMLEEAVRKADEEQVDMLVYKADFYDNLTGIYRPCLYGIRENMLPRQRPFAGVEIEKDVFKVFVGWTWDKLFRRDFVKENHLRFQEQRTSNDLVFVFSALIRAKKITTLSLTLAHQRRNTTERLSVTREKSWQCFYYALLELRNEMRRLPLDKRFEVDFVNYALHFSLWNLNTLKEPTRRKLYYQLKDSWFKELGISDLPETSFYHKGEYNEYRAIMNTPYEQKMMSMTFLYRRGKAIIRRMLMN